MLDAGSLFDDDWKSDETIIGEPCPRCGRRIDYIRIKRQYDGDYYYAVHYTVEGRRECYLGPVGRYVIVKRKPRVKQEARGEVMDPDTRLVSYIKNIAVYIASNRRELKPALEQKNLLSELWDAVRNIYETVASMMYGSRLDQCMDECMKKYGSFLSFLPEDEKKKKCFETCVKSLSK